MTQAPFEGQSGTVAPLANVGLCHQAVQQVMDRPGHLPGMITFYGPSGYGKSTAAAYTANKTRAYYIQCMSSWTRKALLQAVLREMGLTPHKTLYEMTEQIAEQLVVTGRPLIIDEVDHIVSKSAVEIIRDLYEGSNAPILLIGEERLPHRLQQWERFHNRMLDWVAAQPASIEDTRHLARLYAPGVTIAEDLLGRIQEVSRGSVRRVCVNIEQVRAEAQQLGRTEMDLQAWGRRELFSGEPPKRRV